MRKLAPAGQGADPVLRRPARRRQDLARPVDRARHGPQVRARQPRRRARRGRDPRPPAHLYRRAARQHHPGDPQGRRAQLRDDARRDRQARRRHPGRSRRRRCSRCSIPSRTTPSATTISACRSISQPRGVHHHRQHARHHSRAAARPHGDHQPRRLHRRARSSRSPSATWCAASSRRTGSSRSRSRSTTTRCATIIDELHARGRRAQPRARDRPRAAPRRGARSPKGRADTIRIGVDDLADHPRAAAVRERGGDAHQRAGRGHRPRLDAGRRRHPVHRGDAHAGQRQADPHRPARRRDEARARRRRSAS